MNPKTFSYFAEAPIGIFLVDASGRYIDANPAACELTGYSLAELTQKSITDLIDKASVSPKDLPGFGQLLKTGKANVQTRAKKKDGTFFWMTVNAVASGNGTFTAYCQDITKQKLVEEKARQQEARLQSIFLAASVGIGLVQDRKLIEVNDRICQMIGYASEELIGQSARIFYPSQEDFDYVGQQKYEQIRKKGTGTVETRWAHKDGSIINILLRSTPLDPNDFSIGVTFTALDITNQKRAEAELKESEERYRALFDRSSDCVFLHDLTGNFLDANEAALRLLDYEKAEITALNFQSLVNDQDLEMAMQVLQQILEKGFQEKTTEFCLRSKKGEIKCVETLSSVVYRNGEPYAIQGIARDITERKKLEQDRLALENKIQQVQKQESLGILAGGIAHDFNNLLAVILGNAELAMMDLKGQPQLMESVQEINEAALRSAELVKKMLEYSGRGQLSIASMNLTELIDQNSLNFKESIAKRIELKYQIDSSVPAVMADASQIRQVLLSLITNASEAIGDQNGSITLRTGQLSLDEASRSETANQMHPSAPGDYAYFEVVDNGSGMDDYTRARIFDPFYSTKFIGRGLGLAAVQGIVRGHDGGIFLDSKLGQGTTFRVLLPLAPAPEAAEAQSDQAIPARPILGTILLVDDEKSVLSIARRMLQRLDYDVVEAVDGMEAVDIFLKDPDRFAGVICDLSMPRMDGEQCFLELRRIRPQIPFLLTSGYNKQEMKQRFSRHHFSNFMQKPFRLEVLKQLLLDVLPDP